MFVSRNITNTIYDKDLSIVQLKQSTWNVEDIDLLGSSARLSQENQVKFLSNFVLEWEIRKHSHE